MIDLIQILENRSWCKNLSFERRIIAVLVELMARIDRSDSEVQDTFTQIVASLYTEEQWLVLENQFKDMREKCNHNVKWDEKNFLKEYISLCEKYDLQLESEDPYCGLDMGKLNPKKNIMQEHLDRQTYENR